LHGMMAQYDEKLAEVIAEDEVAASSTRSGSLPGEVANDAWRSSGTLGKIEGGGHPWDAFFNAPQASIAPSEATVLPLEDARDAIVDRTGRPSLDSRLGALVGGDDWPLGPDGKVTDTRLSHLMCRVLRYHTKKLGVSVDEDPDLAWVTVPALLASLPELEHSTEEDVRRVVKDSIGSKGSRFELRVRPAAEGDEDAGATEVRATYRHPRDGGRRAFGGGGRGYRHRGHYGLPYGMLPAGNGVVAPYGYRPGFSRQPLPGADHEDEAYRQAAFASIAAAASRPSRSRPGAAGALAAAPVTDGEVATSARANGCSLLETAPAGQAAEEVGIDRPEIWGRWFEPETNRIWFHNEATGETFFADDANSGWERFEDAEGRPWWWNDAQGRFFFEED